MAAMYGVWHGPEGLKNIATRTNHLTQILHTGVSSIGFSVVTPIDKCFDTISIKVPAAQADKIIAHFETKEINLARISSDIVNISLNETTTIADVEELLNTFAEINGKPKQTWKFSSPYHGLAGSLK